MRLEKGKLYIAIIKDHICYGCILKHVDHRKQEVVKSPRCSKGDIIYCIDDYDGNRCFIEYIPISDYLDKLKKKYVDK